MREEDTIRTFGSVDISNRTGIEKCSFQGSPVTTTSGKGEKHNEQGDAMNLKPRFRTLPAIDGESAYFWTGGAEDELRIMRCQTCGFWVHPPVGICPNCLSRKLAPQATSGTGTLFSYTVNHQVADKRVETPYIIALIELDEQPNLRLLGNLVNCAEENVTVGMPVRVTFEQHDDTFIPVWEPAG